MLDENCISSSILQRRLTNPCRCQWEHFHRHARWFYLSFGDSMQRNSLISATVPDFLLAKLDKKEIVNILRSTVNSVLLNACCLILYLETELYRSSPVGSHLSCPRHRPWHWALTEQEAASSVSHICILSTYGSLLEACPFRRLFNVVQPPLSLAGTLHDAGPVRHKRRTLKTNEPLAMLLECDSPIDSASRTQDVLYVPM